jgi:hypothetical protein
MREKPLTQEEFEHFQEYCYTGFGLHFVGDIVKKHTILDGDAIVKQVRQALATIEQMKPIYDTAMLLAIFVEENGVVLDGFRTRELLLDLVEERKRLKDGISG